MHSFSGPLPPTAETAVKVGAPAPPAPGAPVAPSEARTLIRRPSFPTKKIHVAPPCDTVQGADAAFVPAIVPEEPACAADESPPARADTRIATTACRHIANHFMKPPRTPHPGWVVVSITGHSIAAERAENPRRDPAPPKALLRGAILPEGIAQGERPLGMHPYSEITWMPFVTAAAPWSEPSSRMMPCAKKVPRRPTPEGALARTVGAGLDGAVGVPR